MALDDARHPDAERLAEYAEGVLEADARADVERHLADCADCRAVVMDTMAFLESSSATPSSASASRVVPFRSRRWVTGVVAGLAAAAALVLAVRVARPEWASGLFGPRSDRPELQELIAAVANEPTRPVEGRLTGGFKYAPPPSPTRGPGDREVSPDVRIAAAKIEKLARDRDTPESQALLGTAYLAVGELDKAIDAIQAAADQRPRDARFQNDLSAAYLARASRQGRAADWASALAAADRAIALDSKQPEPHFNRAVALEGLHLSDEARAAWQQYQSLDPSTGWASEGASRMRALEAPARPLSSLGGSEFDHQTVRERIEDQLLREWSAAIVGGDDAAAFRLLGQMTPLAERLASEGGDGMPLDELRRLRTAATRHDRSTLKELAAGHAAYSEARERYLKSEFVEAAARMAEASAHFRRVNSPYAFWAPLYEATAQRRPAPRTALDAVSAVRLGGVPENFYALRGTLEWTHGVVLDALERFDLGRERLQRAVRMFRQAGEIGNLNATQTILGEAEWFLGDRERAWTDVVEVLARADHDVSARRNYYHLLVAAMFSLESDLPHAALEFQNRLVSVSMAAGGSARAEAYIRRASVLARFRERQAALDDLESAVNAAAALTDPGLRDRNAADVRGLRAELLTGVDNRRAEAEANAALEYVRLADPAARLAALLVLRGKSRELLGDLRGAEEDLRGAIDAFESKRAKLTTMRDRMQAFEEERAAFKNLVELEVVRRGDQLEGLRVAERARAGVLLETWNGARAPVDPTIARGLISPQVAVAYYETLPDRVLIWVLTKEGITHLARSMPQSDVVAAVGRVNRAIRNGADSAGLRPSSRELMENLISPVLALARAKSTLVFVPDGALFSLPFSALPDANGAPLVASWMIGIAPSLTTFLAASARLADFSPSDVLTIGDGHDPEASGVPSLPLANAEATTVATFYSGGAVLIGAHATRRRVLAEDRSVIHFAGHTIVNRQFPLLSRLLLAPDTADNDGGSLLASDIANHRFVKTRLVVLASCDGAAGRVIDGEGLISVAGAFFGAGVPSVVASLWPVGDDTHELLTAFHRELRPRSDVLAALRASQLSLLQARGPHVAVREWGGFVALGGSRTAVNHDEEVAWHK